MGSDSGAARHKLHNYETTKLHNSLASGDGGDDGNRITVVERGGFFVQVAHVFVVDVDVDEGAELAVIVIEMTLQVGMLADRAR